MCNTPGLFRHRRWRGGRSHRHEGGGEKAGLKPRARIRSFDDRLGADHQLTGRASPPSAPRKAGMKREDLDLWELNEAFASVVLRFMDVLNVPHDKINVNGGAIAMGHPLGATGAMVLGCLFSMRWSGAARAPASSRFASARAWAPRRFWNGIKQKERPHPSTSSG